MELCEFLFGIFEGFFELAGKKVIDGILYLCMWLAGLIFPEKTLSAGAQKRIRRAVTVYTALLVIAFIVGVILLMESTAVVFAMCLSFVPLGLIALQLAVGIVFYCKHK